MPGARRSNCPPAACRGGSGWGGPFTIRLRTGIRLKTGAGDENHSTQWPERRSNMDQAITRSSRLLGLAGVAGIIFGIGALVWPGITLAVLVALFGAYALVAGVFTLVAGLDFATERASHWVPMVFGGLAGIAIGVFTFFNFGNTALALVFLIAALAILTGILHGA